MELGDLIVVKSVGYGVYLVSAPGTSAARSAGEQIGHVLEAWEDEEPGLHVLVLDGGHATSRYEAAIAGDPEVSVPLRRVSSASPVTSVLRGRLAMIDAACATVLKEKNVAPSKG